MGVRRKGRELALQMLYQWDVTRAPFGEVVWSMDEIRKPSKEARDFGRSLAEGTFRRLEDIDALITAQSDSWRLSRMAAVDRNILRIAVYEFLDTETPKRVVINEALEITKRFSAGDAVSFVNGVLDAICANIEATSESR